MFRRILVPTDGSYAAQKAVETAAHLARREGDAQITVVVAVHPLEESSTDLDQDTVIERNASMRTAAERALRSAVQMIGNGAVTCETKVLEGGPVSAVVAQEAATGGYDAIVIGSRNARLSRANPRRLGSVTEHVLQRVGVPVVVVPVEPETPED